jgi:hypothetical protein
MPTTTPQKHSQQTAVVGSLLSPEEFKSRARKAFVIINRLESYYNKAETLKSNPKAIFPLELML